MALRPKILERLRRNNRDDNIPQSRPDNDPSLAPSAEIASTSLVAAPPPQVGSLIDPSSSTTPIQNDSDNRTQQITDEGADNRKKNYWQLAIDKLINEDPSFSKAIASLQQAAAEAGCGFTDQLLKLTEEAHKKLISRRWEFKFGGKTIVPRDQLTNVVAVIDSFKDVGTVASSFERTFAGLPWAGFCVLLHLATSDTKQYMDMVAGAQEVATITLRYKEVEELYMLRQETKMTEEFAARLISLYMNIIRYQIAVTYYYGRSPILRFLRAIPNLDDVSDTIKAIRQEDAACKDIVQVFQFRDSTKNFQKIQTTLNRVEARLPEPHSIPWIVPRPVNSFFMGRSEILKQIEEAIQRNLGESDHSEPCTIVITGIGGQGKSEICLKIANRLRKEFQGVFWVDVSTVALAEIGFINIAEAIHCDAKNLEEARQALSSFEKPWLLVLDNADNPTFDYQAYLPTGTYGVVLMTSRDSGCSRFATVLGGDLTLEGLDDDSARALLLKAAKILPKEWTLYKDDAQAICALLKSHPLALIQAGSYVARGHCKLSEYPDKFHHHCKPLLEFASKQRQSRYGHVYATFEVSAEVLQSSSDEAARDALEILSMLSMIGHSPLPLAIFKATWEGAQEIIEKPFGRKQIYSISARHARQLISPIKAVADKWDESRLKRAIGCLTSYSLITANEKNGRISSISVHSLIHAWAKERQTIQTRHQSWITTGSIFTISSTNQTFWMKYDLQLKPHLQAYLDCKVSDMLNCGPRLIVIQIIMNCARLLTDIQENSKLPSLLEDIFKTMNLDNKTVSKEWEPLYQIYGINLRQRGKIKDAIQLLEEVLKNKTETLIPEDPSRQKAQHELAKAYLTNGQMGKAISLLKDADEIEKEALDPKGLAATWANLEEALNLRGKRLDPEPLISKLELARGYLHNGQTNQAVSLLEEVVKNRENTLDPEHTSRIISQHELARAYLLNGQTKDAVLRLEEVVKIEEKALGSDHPNPLPSQHLLGTAYLANGQTKEAISLLEKVVKIKEDVLDPKDPSRLESQHELARAYNANGQMNEAISLLNEVVKIKEKVLDPEDPSLLESQHLLGTAYLANGQTKEAIPLLEKAVKIKEDVLDPKDPSRLESQHELARAYNANGQMNEAISLLNEVVKIKEKVLDPENPSLLESQHELARAYNANGQMNEAISLLNEVVKIKEKVLDPEDPSLPESQQLLGTAYLANGQTKEAIPLLEKAVKIKEKVLDPEDPSLPESQQLLGTAYLANGQTKEAIPLLEKAVKGKEKVLDPEDLSRLELQHELARAYNANGQMNEAISLLNEVVKIKEKVPDPENPSLLESQHLLGTAYLANGQTKEAIPLLERAVEGKEKVLDPEDPSRLELQHELARAYNANRQMNEAISLFEEVVKIKEKLLDPKDPSRLESQHLLGTAYLANGQIKEAISLLNEVVKIKETVLDPENSSRLESQQALAQAYESNGKRQRLYRFLRRLSRLEKKTLDPDHPS